MLQEACATSVAHAAPASPLGPDVGEPRLSRRERQILAAIFALGNRASVEGIRARMADPPSYSVVRVTLARLGAKGHVTHAADGIRYLYSATKSPGAAKRGALREYVHTFFGGSLRQMVLMLLRDSRWSDDDLEALRREIERVKNERQQ